MLAVLRTALLSILIAFKQADGPPAPLRFQLRHEHGVTKDSRIIFADVPPSLVSDTYEIPTRDIKSYSPESHTAFMSARSRSMRYMQSQPLMWEDHNIPGPDVNKRQALLQLAKMTSNSYVQPGDKDWYEVDSTWNVVRSDFLLQWLLFRNPFHLQSYPFGWEPDADGFRGHIFATEDNSTVVISVKGTSAGWLVGGGGPTVAKDKVNDNMLFSCCCARVGPTWSTVCGCHLGGYRCDQTCLERSLVEDSLYYPIGTVRCRCRLHTVFLPY